MVADEGSGAMSLRKLARRAGVSPAAPYHHFGDRSGLLSALAVEGFHELDRALADVSEANDDPSTALAEACAAYVRFAVEHGDHYQYMFSADYADADKHREYHEVALASFGTLVGKVARVATHAEHGEAAQLALAIWAMCHGMAQLCIDGLLDTAPGSDLPLDVSKLAALAGEASIKLARPDDREVPLDGE